MNTRTIRVLLVEDNADDAVLFREMFRKEQPGSFELAHRERMSDAVDYLTALPVDIVLLDMGLPDCHGLETGRRAHTAAPKVPLIVLTGLDDEDIAAQALKDGALDYLVKGQIENRALPRALRYAIERHQTQMETEKIRNQQLQLKDEFLSHVSRELRSPLTAIYEFVSILTDGIAGEMSSEQAEYLQVTMRNVLQLRSMIDDLLDVTRAQGGKLRREPSCGCGPPVPTKRCPEREHSLAGTACRAAAGLCRSPPSAASDDQPDLECDQVHALERRGDGSSKGLRSGSKVSAGASGGYRL